MGFTRHILLVLWILSAFSTMGRAAKDPELWEKCEKTLRILVERNAALADPLGKLVSGLAPWNFEEIPVPPGKNCLACAIEILGARGKRLSSGDIITYVTSSLQIGMILSTFRDGSGMGRALVLTQNGTEIGIDVLSAREQETAETHPGLKSKWDKLVRGKTADWTRFQFNSLNGLPQLEAISLRPDTLILQGSWVTYLAEVAGRRIEKVAQVQSLLGYRDQFPQKILVVVGELDSLSQLVFRMLSAEETQSLTPLFIPDGDVPTDILLRMAGPNEFYAWGGDKVGPGSRVSWSNLHQAKAYDFSARVSGELKPFEFSPELLLGRRTTEVAAIPAWTDAEKKEVDLSQNGTIPLVRRYDMAAEESQAIAYAETIRRIREDVEFPLSWDRETLSRKADPLGGRRYVTRLLRLAPAKPDGWDRVDLSHWIKRFPEWMSQLGYEVTPDGLLSYPDATGFNSRLEKIAPPRPNGLLARWIRTKAPLNAFRFESVSSLRMRELPIEKKLETILSLFSNQKFAMPDTGAAHFGLVTILPALVLIPPKITKALVESAKFLKRVFDEVPEMRRYLAAPTLALEELQLNWAVALQSSIHMGIEAYAKDRLSSRNLYMIDRPENVDPKLIKEMISQWGDEDERWLEDPIGVAMSPADLLDYLKTEARGNPYVSPSAREALSQMDGVPRFRVEELAVTTSDWQSIQEWLKPTTKQ